MPGDDVLKVLEKAKRPLSRTDIANIMEESLSLVSHLIQRLIKAKDIKIIEIDRVQAMKLYHCKRRMRLYYI